jgi:hypothetical protein
MTSRSSEALAARDYVREAARATVDAWADGLSIDAGDLLSEHDLEALVDAMIDFNAPDGDE